MHYSDPFRRLKPTLLRYRHLIAGRHAAVVGTEMPWAEAILANLGARRITTLEYRPLSIDDDRVFTVTPSQFATEFLQATDDDGAKTASYYKQSLPLLLTQRFASCHTRRL